MLGNPMRLELTSKLRKTIATGILMLLVLILSTYQALAQVTFEVSQENKHSVLSKFSNGALVKALKIGKVNPGDIFKIYVGAEEKEEIGDRSAILGTYRTIPGQIIFEPLVPFSEALPYLAVFGDSVEYQFQLTPPPNRPPTRLLEVYPTTDTVPANLLKIYLQFSEPMREGEVYDRVRIYGQNGDLIKNPFVPLHPELWDTSGRMVTLWLDPGRVKRALSSRETYGPIIEEGRSYRLMVDTLWKDAHGHTLETGFTKPFHVIPADRTKPETRIWQLTVPLSLTQNPLIIAFGEPMDFATTQHAFSVWSAKGEPLAGLTEVTGNEKIWKFVPKKHWISGIYRLKVYSKLEDLAGNNLNKVFDRDLANESMTPSVQEFYWIEFEVSDGK